MSEANSPVRPVHVFTVPAKISEACGVKEIGLVALTADDEIACFKRGAGSSARLAGELAKASLAEVDGKKVTVADGSIDTFWKNADPRLRQLLLTAYTEIHAPEEEDQNSFLKSRQIRVG